MNRVKYTLLIASMLLAITFTFSCSLDDGGGSTGGRNFGSTSSSSNLPPGTDISSSGASNGSSSSVAADGSSSSEDGGGDTRCGGAYCQWDTGCWPLDSEYDTKGRTCSALIDECNSWGHVFHTGSQTEGEGIKCIPPRNVVYGTPVEHGGEIYETVVIGTQTWLNRNLNVANSAGYSTCYNDDPANCEKYGRLYDWRTAMALPSSLCEQYFICEDLINTPYHQGICPEGFHIPTSAEWNKLLGFISSFDAMLSYDVYGFSNIPGGIYEYYIYNSLGQSSYRYNGSGTISYFWSPSTRVVSNGYGYANYYSIYNNMFGMDYAYKASYLSVRCVKDE